MSVIQAREKSLACMLPFYFVTRDTTQASNLLMKGGFSSKTQITPNVSTKEIIVAMTTCTNLICSSSYSSSAMKLSFLKLKLGKKFVNRTELALSAIGYIASISEIICAYYFYGDSEKQLIAVLINGGIGGTSAFVQFLYGRKLKAIEEQERKAQDEAVLATAHISLLNNGII